jgi:hypothetical protein
MPNCLHLSYITNEKQKNKFLNVDKKRVAHDWATLKIKLLNNWLNDHRLKVEQVRQDYRHS